MKQDQEQTQGEAQGQAQGQAQNELPERLNYIIKPVYDPPKAQAEEAQNQEEKKIPVSVVSNSFHFKPIVDKKEDGTIEVSVKGFPGGLARGVDSAFGQDSDYKMLRWHATDQQRLTEEGTVDEPVQQMINETMRRSSSEIHFLDRETKQDWYEHATNGLYWPFLHELTQYVTEVDKSDTYEKVNKDIAKRIVDAIKEEHEGEVPEDAIVWVQDYHFNSSIGYMKDDSPDLNVGYFLHVPFPEINATMQKALSTHLDAITTSLKSLLRADSIGFHTEKDKENFVKTLENLGLVSGAAHKQEIVDKILVNPIGIPKDVVKKNYHEAMISQTEARITFDDNLEKNSPETATQEALNDWVGVNGNLSPIKILNDKAQEWVKGKEADARGDMTFDPNKIHIGSVSRTDYTKGIHELLEGYRDFLRDKRAQGIETPQEKYQLNVVASPPRDMDAFKVYQQEALKIADAVLEEFPGSLNFIPGVGFEELPLFNSAMSVIAATSFRDGYILAVGEALIGKTAAFESKLLQEDDIPSGLIVSTGAGIALSLEKNERGEVEVPEALSLVEPTAEAIKGAIQEQVGRIEVQRSTDLSQRDLGGFYKLADRLEDTSDFGRKALDPLKAKILGKKLASGEELTAREFNQIPVTRMLATDSDGTVVAANADPAIQVPPKEFVEQMRTFSLENPQTAIAILSGRADAYLQEHYSAAFTPDEEGRVPKIMLMSENGAFLRTSTDPDTLHTLTEPFTPEVKAAIENITKEAAGEYFRENDQNLDPSEVSIWLDPKETTYGIFRRTPVDPEKQVIMNGILEEIKTGLEQLESENPGLHINLGAVDAFLVEKVSKGITVNELMTDKLDSSLRKAGMSVGPITSMTYAGDDVADIAAQNEVNEALDSGVLKEGYTTRINDYAPNFSPNAADLMTRTAPKSPKDPAAQDSFYMLGDKDTSGQDQHREYFMNNEAFEKVNAVREALSERGLLPSQSGDSQTPPIAILASGDILIQKPELYSEESLQKLQDWSKGKVVMLVDQKDASRQKLESLVGNNINLVAVSTKGAVYTRGQYSNFQSNLTAAKAINTVISANAERSAEIQQLRAIQAMLVSIGVLKVQKVQPAAALQESAAVGGMSIEEDSKPAASETRSQQAPAGASRQAPPAFEESEVGISMDEGFEQSEAGPNVFSGVASSQLVAAAPVADLAQLGAQPAGVAAAAPSEQVAEAPSQQAEAAPAAALAQLAAQPAVAAEGGIGTRLRRRRGRESGADESQSTKRQRSSRR